MESLSLLMNGYLRQRLLLETEPCQRKSGHRKAGEGPILAFPIPQEEENPAENEDNDTVSKFVCEVPTHDKHVEVADESKNRRQRVQPHFEWPRNIRSLDTKKN